MRKAVLSLVLGMLMVSFSPRELFAADDAFESCERSCYSDEECPGGGCGQVDNYDCEQDCLERCRTSPTGSKR